MDRFFAFDEMITPKIITFLYFLAVIVSILWGLGFAAVTIFSGQGNILFRLIAGPTVGVLIVVAGILASRIYCELLIVIFKIHENLRRVAEHQTGQASE